MKGVLVLEDWINESRMEDLEKNWSVQPGDVRSRVDLAEWLLFAMREILVEDDELRRMDPDDWNDANCTGYHRWVNRLIFTNDTY